MYKNVIFIAKLGKAKANLELKDNQGATAVFLAAEQGMVSAVNVLAELGADLSVADNYSQTVLHTAADHGFSRTVEALCALDVDLDAEDEGVAM